ncbi:MAG: hypothetical protein EZS28_024262, partial [Streblomastix strix]
NDLQVRKTAAICIAKVGKEGELLLIQTALNTSSSSSLIRSSSIFGLWSIAKQQNGELSECGRDRERERKGIRALIYSTGDKDPDVKVN